jgi:MoaA/NifB/PqqE/SkfB family radical SAM enzyme
MQQKHRKSFDDNIIAEFNKARLIMKSLPGRLPFFVQAVIHQKTASRKRQALARQGLEVPPLLIISITKRCMLNCAGCYSKLLHSAEEEELNPQQFAKILSEAGELGISIVMLAGGEPLMRPEILEVAAQYTRIIFPIFTNGLAFSPDYAAFFAGAPHLIPIISLEGGESETDARRGDGVYANFTDISTALNQAKVFWGISLTLTSQNYEGVLSEEYARQALEKGAKLVFFVEYVPVAEGSEELVLSDLQKAELNSRVEQLTKALPGLFIAFPGDEDQYEGCLAAGRGFMHINPWGKVEPCPFAPFSDTDLRYSSLREALESRFLQKIRENHHLLKEGKGGCALWANREWVQEISS